MRFNSMGSNSIIRTTHAIILTTSPNLRSRQERQRNNVTKVLPIPDNKSQLFPPISKHMCLFDVHLISANFQCRVSPVTSNSAINLQAFYELLLREKLSANSKAGEGVWVCTNGVDWESSFMQLMEVSRGTSPWGHGFKTGFGYFEFSREKSRKIVLMVFCITTTSTDRWIVQNSRIYSTVRGDI